MGHIKRSSKREVYSDTGLPQERRKITNIKAFAQQRKPLTK